jgi:thioredoxin-related protein
MLVRRFVLVGMASVFLGLFATAGFGRAEDSLWQTDFEAAKTKAKAEKKLLLVDFTGTGWCKACKVLKKEILDQDAFKNEAPKQFVLVEVDFPSDRSKQTAKLKAQNAKLAKAYKIEAYPTVLLMDADGQVIAKTIGCPPDGPQKYLERIGNFARLHESVVQMKSKLTNVQGPDRIRLLDQLIDACRVLQSSVADQLTWGKEIVALDPENKTGLKKKYGLWIPTTEAGYLMGEKRPAEAVAVLDRALEIPGLTDQQKLDLYSSKLECYERMPDYVGMISCMKKASKLQGNSSKVSYFLNNLSFFAPKAEAQATIERVEPKLDKAVGIERGKLLNQLIDAYQAVNSGARWPYKKAPDYDACVKEIRSLDPENRAGLLTNDDFRTAMNKVGSLEYRSDPNLLDEIITVLNKALTIPKLTDEQKKKIHETLQEYMPFAKAHSTFVKLLPKLDKAKGAERIGILDQLIEAYSAYDRRYLLIRPSPVLVWYKEVISMDAKSRAGLKPRNQFDLFSSAWAVYWINHKNDEAEIAIDNALALPGISPEQIQQLQSQKSDIYMAREEWRKCLDGLKKALEAAPQSPSAGQIRERISYVEEQIGKAEKSSKTDEPKAKEKK